jgi:hypothetical protein|tara:strand:+ start:134 stop:880 length:747 start_codon:yes stop_codon:yes gene_type:complete
MKANYFKKQIDKNGFIIIKKLINKKEIKELLRGYETIIDYCISLISKKKKFKNLDQKYLWLQKRNNNLKKRGYDVSRFHPSLYKVVFNKKLKSIIKDCFKSDPLVEDPQIRINDCANTRLLPMHQEVYGQISSNMLTLWLPLSDVSPSNGTISFIKGSHKRGLLKSRFYKINKFKAHGVSKKLYKNSEKTLVTLKAGDGLLFHHHLIHGSEPNKSKKIRYNYIVRFNKLSGVSYLSNLKSPLRIPQKG